MTLEQWKQVEVIFNAALDRPVDERESFLNEACGGDVSLRREIEHLINCHEQAGDFIEGLAATSPDSPPPDEAITLQLDIMIGRQVGAYKLVREIGRGGMGAVYLAARADNQFRQRAAIKLVKRGMDTDFIIRRFRNERQILAALNHPNIARLLDGGATDDGLPYFVMEYIDGLRIHRYCDTHRLTIKDRLKLFRQVCAAVHYAHENQVIHRDIKPGNVLVTADGTPKLLDFGIAKILDPELAIETVDPTVTAMRMMTPEYASPEQACGEQVCAATDQYSLGVMLYELLTGHRPYHFSNRLPYEIARIISEEQPTRPSDVVLQLGNVTAGDGKRSIALTPETVSHERSTSPESLRRELANELDNIVMQTLQKRPEQRYRSVQELSQDINRYLQGAPIIAPVYSAPPEQKAIVLNASPPVIVDPELLDRLDADSAPTAEFTAPPKASRRALIIYAALIVVTASALLFYYLSWRSTRHDAAAAIATPIRLTNNIVQDIYPKVSPDGTKIVFISDRTGMYEIYVMNIDGSGVTPLTSNSLQEGAPAWSPDGRKIVYEVVNAPLIDSDIWIMNADGSNQINLTNSPGFDSRAAFSPDGTRIAFGSNRGNADKYNYDVWVMNADGSDQHRLTDYYEFESDVTWSPDSKRIAFVRAMPNRHFDMFTMNADGSNQVNLTNTPEIDENVPSWSPNGKDIAFSSTRDSQNDNHDIWVINIDGSNLRRITNHPATDSGPSWTPDGRLVFGSNRDFNQEIYLVDVPGSGSAQPVKSSEALRKSIAVLPFKSKIASEAENLLGVGLADVITNRLGQIKLFSVRPASAVPNYLESNFDPRRAASELGVEYVISGALSHEGDHLRIDLQTYSLTENKTIWTAKIDEKLTDLTTLQNSITEGILRSLAVESDTAKQSFFIKRETESNDAYQLYLAGRYHWSKRSLAGLNEAIKSFNKAIEKDRKFALAYAGLADCYALLQIYQVPPPADGYRKLKENALKALSLDDSLAEAHVSLAYAKFYSDRDRRGAESLYRRAIDLNPSYATAHHWLAVALSALNRPEEAIAEIKEAMRLNPQSAMVKIAAGMIYAYARRYDQALNECRQALELDPGSFQAHRMIRWIHQCAGHYNEALAAYQKEREFGDDGERNSPILLAQLQTIGGKREEARSTLKRLIAALPAIRPGDFQPFEIAVAYALLGDRDQAFRWLARADAAGSYGFNFILVEPRLDNLRDDPRYQWC